ncbi:hypothetical protein [Azospirillum thermophilum]|uniref:hypothetical protein n=1 Tax=Azospirillum thermophilum TaxID=2202148 RepID=UPI001FE2B331|nr:hypothetical protein [Azospirillum thermophilum]
MTIAGYGMEEEGRGPGLARWGGGLLLALGAHAGLAVGVMAWHTPVEPDAAPPAAVMIDLAPLPVAPPPAEAPPSRSRRRK